MRAAIVVGLFTGGLVVVTAVFAHRYWVVLCSGAALVASHEVVRRLREAGYVIPVIPLLVGGQVTVWLTWPFHAAGAMAGFGGTVVVCMMWRLFMQDNSKRPEPFAGSPSANYLRDASATVFLAAWVPLFASFAALLGYPHDGTGRVFCLMGTVVASDVGGYAVGVLFGKHPMVPAISPKKSWEGLAGSMVFGITAAILIATLLAHKPWWIGALLGVVLVFTCTLGDLVESQVKRDLGIKDMGRLLPGHGGLMDRLDGVLPSAVATWTVLTLLR
ncbi:phosphatidate cytidylyltransferase [Mycobacterium sp. 663a-19]|nr:phosphatidate cytidylyltransferase [Mycobacterium sp. 663a-19]MEB3983972.1 phosphatidate cytidylyltransferase [Mycobacterium sp. 663a-19]